MFFLAELIEQIKERFDSGQGVVISSILLIPSILDDRIVLKEHSYTISFLLF